MPSSVPTRPGLDLPRPRLAVNGDVLRPRFNPEWAARTPDMVRAVNPSTDELFIPWTPVPAQRRRLALAMMRAMAVNWRMWVSIIATLAAVTLVFVVVLDASWTSMLKSCVFALVLCVPLLVMVPPMRALRRYPVGEQVMSGIEDGEFRTSSSRGGLAVPMTRVVGASELGGIVTIRTMRPKAVLLVPREAISEKAYELLASADAHEAVPHRADESRRADLREVTVTWALQWQLTFAASRLAFRWWWRLFLVLYIALMSLLILATGDWGILVDLGWPLLLFVVVLVVPRYLITRATCPVGSVISGSYGDGLVLRTAAGMSRVVEAEIGRRLVTRRATAFKIGPTIVAVPRSFGDR